jgi:tripartite-type tricarboxylate transporter receptor subunit TctC
MTMIDSKVIGSSRLHSMAAMAALLALGLTTRAEAQDYPSRTVRIIVPYAAGGSIDPSTRLLADKLSRQMGQTFVVENRPGAGGNIGIEAAARSAPDGYTLLSMPAAIAINPSLYAKVPYDVEKDLTPVGMLYRTPMVMLTSPKTGIKSLADFMARVREKPGQVNYAISGNGTLDHLVCENFRASANLNMVKVNYGGVPKGITALLAGEVDMMVVSAGPAMPYILSGQLVPLAVTGEQRTKALPDVPTMEQAGFKDFKMYGLAMFLVPSQTPGPVTTKLNSEIEKALALPDVQKMFTDVGAETPKMTMAEIREYLRQQSALFAGIVRSSGARVD